MAAAQRGRVKFVKSLVEHGADINAEDAVSLVYIFCVLVSVLYWRTNVSLISGQLDPVTIRNKRRP